MTDLISQMVPASCNRRIAVAPDMPPVLFGRMALGEGLAARRPDRAAMGNFGIAARMKRFVIFVVNEVTYTHTYAYIILYTLL